jgi:hypothetical protein
VPLYYVQREPSELGSFTWVIDGKEPHKITNWEAWWSWYAHGAVATMSRRRPSPKLSEGVDYSFYDRFRGQDGGEEGIDLRLLLKDLKFSSSAEPGLELIDILVNATRRALMSNLQKEGWKNIPKLMVHRKENYIGFLAFGGQHSGYKELQVPYTEIAQHFCYGGKLMMTPEMHRIAKESEDQGAEHYLLQ